jgi:hypothetical protein
VALGTNRELHFAISNFPVLLLLPLPFPLSHKSLSSATLIAFCFIASRSFIHVARGIYRSLFSLAARSQFKRFC